VAPHKITRIVWMLNPATDFLTLVEENFAPVAAGPVWQSDLTGQSDSRRLREYELAW
jgi:hypothetical protein